MAFTRHSFTDEAEILWHYHLASKIFRLDLDNASPVQADRNILSFASPDICFAQRLDSRTYFVQSSLYGHDRPASVFKGADETQFAFARTLMQGLGISEKEIAKQELFREYGQAAQVDHKTRKIIKLEQSVELRTSVHITRQMEGIPIWSSHFKMGLTAEQKIGFLELHWPIIPDAVLCEARRLAFKIDNGWKVPDVPKAKVESVEAGIIHTPAVGYFLDIHPAIRVIYKSLDPTIGRKPMYHLDRHGAPVLLRQTSELITEPSPGTRRNPDHAH